MQVLLGCLTRGVSPVTACTTRGKKGRGEKSGKREKKRRSSFSLHSGREKEAKGFFYLPTPPFSLPPCTFRRLPHRLRGMAMEQNSVLEGKRRESRFGLLTENHLRGRARWVVNEYLHIYLTTQSDGK